ncbi:MAG: amidohydrolase [Leucobacter sp.]
MTRDHRASREAAATQADTVLRHGRVYTVDAGFRVAQAIALRDGRVLAVGSDAEIDALIAPDTDVIELGGRAVLPGIDDSHLHGAAWGLGSPPYSLDLSYPNVRSIADIVDLVRRTAAERPAGEWIVGQGWDTGYLEECLAGERTLPDRTDLDAVAPEHPVCLSDFSGHMACVNSAALRVAGVASETEAPAGGVIDRDAAGEATGILREGAQDLVQSVIPRADHALRKRAIADAVRRLNARGITAFTEPGLGPGGEGILGGALGGGAIRAYEELLDEGELTARVSVLLLPLAMGESADGLRDRVRAQLAEHPVADPELLRIIGVKLFADGVPPNETSYMWQPYGPSQGHGSLCVHGATEPLRETELRRAISEVHELGLQAGVHVTGDHGIDITVDAFVEANERHPRDDARHYVIHGDFISDERLAQLGERGYGVNMNPGIKAQITDLMDTVVGEELSARQWPTRSAADSGATLCASSDAPVTQPDWLAGIAGMMSRKSKATGRVSGPEQRIDFATALRAYTINAARQSFAEEWRGSLEPGKAADLVVLDTDSGSVDPDELTAINVDLTIFGGEVVFERL